MSYSLRFPLLLALSALLSALLSATLVLGCSKSHPDSAQPSANTTDEAGGTKPVPGPDGVPLDCPILNDGLCYQSLDAAATAAGKDPATCSIAESYPGQLVCEQAAAPTAGVEPVLGDDGIPVDCPILYDGLCYRNGADAAAAAGKDPSKCVVAESYPGQLSCSE